MTELKACPFCGDKASATSGVFRDECSVMCDTCGAESGWFDTQEEADVAWNRRQPTWQPIATAPPHPMPVLYFFGNRKWRNQDGTPAIIDPMRDPAERTEAGWWNGMDWCESGTGHDVFEPWHEPEEFPTHWMPLPEPPDAP